MSERKVLNKYFPPNFDPSKIPKQKKPKDQQHKVRLMAPFSMRCESCSEYIYKGKKFNARKETVHGEKYLSIQIFRFYIRCPRCSAELTFKTDPKNSDYEAENGVTRNFEPWRGDDGAPVDEEEEEGEDAMASLESRTLDSKREMEIMDALDEIRTRNARSERVNVDDVLERFSEDVKQQVHKRLTDEEQQDEDAAVAAFQSADGERVRRVISDNNDEPTDAISIIRQQQQQQQQQQLPDSNNNNNNNKSDSSSSFSKSTFKRKQDSITPSSSDQASKFGIVVKKKKTDNTTQQSTTNPSKNNTLQQQQQPKSQNNALSMLATYDDSSDSDEDS